MSESVLNILQGVCQIAFDAIASHYVCSDNIVDYNLFNSKSDSGGSIKINNKVVLKVYFKSDYIRIVYPKLYSLLVNVPNKYTMLSYPNSECFDILNYAETESLKEMFLQAFDDSCRKDIGCCSRYKECSIAKKCVNKTPDIFLHCYYRYNLKKGKIFY